MKFYQKVIIPVFLSAALTGVSAQQADSSIRVSEKSRKLMILPVENETGSKSYDYLKSGIARMLKDKMSSYGYLAGRADTLFTLQSRKSLPLKRVKAPKKRRGAGLYKLELKVEKAPLNQFTYKALKLFSPARQAHELGGDYLAAGVLRKIKNAKVGEQDVLLELSVYKVAEAKTKIFRWKLRSVRAFKELNEPVRQVFNYISALSVVGIEVDTTESGAMIFLDELYLGRTPLEYHILPGTYKLRVEQEGYFPLEQRVRVAGKGVTVLNIKNKRALHAAGLKVKTNPPGARVYLNADFLGKTPLERADLPPGAHRLRVSMKNHVDKFVGLDLKNGRVRQVSVKLRKGDSKAFFADPGYLVFDWTYYDFSVYSALSSLAFYGGYRYFQMQATRTSSDGRFSDTSGYRQGLPLVLAGGDLGRLTTLLEGLTVGEYLAIQSSNSKIASFRRSASNSAGLSIASMVVAGVFVYLGIRHDNAKGFGEISLSIDAAPRTFAAHKRGAGKPEDFLGFGLHWRF